MDGGERAVDRPDHVCDRDLARRPVEPVAALRAAVTRHETVLAEVHEDVLEELDRDALGRGDALRLDRGVVGGGELERRPHRVVGLGGDAHVAIVAGVGVVERQH